MERLINCRFLLDICFIDCFRGGNRTIEVYFSTKEEKHYKFSFENVWSMHYAIENGYINRFYELKKRCDQSLTESSIFIINESERIEDFRKESSGTLPVDGLTDYIIFDSFDTVLEVLTNSEPVLVEIDREKM